jgi:hypothetical protein
MRRLSCLRIFIPHNRSVTAASPVPHGKGLVMARKYQRGNLTLKKRAKGPVAATTLQGSHPDAGKLLLPALNTMIDITTTRTMALRTHPPNIIYALLFGLGLICSLLAGYRMAGVRRRSWLHMLGFLLITVIVIFVIMDVEYPRTGLIRLSTFDQELIDARAEMN